MRSVLNCLHFMAGMLGVGLFALGSTAYAVDWDVSYEGDVLPSDVVPAWTNSSPGDGSSIVSGGTLRMTDPESWDLVSDPLMLSTTAKSFRYNDPNIAGESFVIKSGRAFTVEWRMRINSIAPHATPSSCETGVKLYYMGYKGGKRVQHEWYYDADNTRLVNNQYKSDYVHAGYTGPEGGESPISIDGFPGVGVGEWHTYRVTSAAIDSNTYLRELWLDGNYVGRWSDEKNSTSVSAELKIRANKDLSPDTDVEFDYIRFADDPEGRYIQPIVSAPPTLLLNQSFEDATGSAQAWMGSYGTTNVDPPSPAFMDGGKTWSFSTGDPNAPLSPQAWQTVAIQPGDTVTLTGYLYAHKTGGAADLTVSLFDGYSGGTQLGTMTVDDHTTGTDGDWVHFTFTGVANSGHVTVTLGGNASVVDWGQVACLYADGFQLTATTPCASNVVVTGVTPSSGNHDANAQLTINGTGLTGATAVNLIQCASGVSIPGNITSQSDTQVLATFATAGQPIGQYNLVAESPSCRSTQYINAYTSLCYNPTQLAGVSPSTVVPPSGSVTLTLTGTNLNGLLTAGSSITLVNGETSLPGSDLVMNGNDLQATFYFGDAPEGFYRVVAVRGDACPDPQPVYLAYLSPTGPNLLTNPGFETGLIAPWVGGSIHSGDYFGCTPHSGTYFAGRASNGGLALESIEQAVVLTPGSYDLVATCWAFVWDVVKISAGEDSYVQMDLLSDGALVGTAKLSSLDRLMSVWTPLAIQWHDQTISGNISVRIIVRADGQGDPAAWGLAAVDDVSLAEGFNPACHDIWADSDGDNDVDMVDFAVFQRCLTTGMTAQPTLSDQCRCFDRIRDGRIDDQDLPIFLNCAGGSQLPVGQCE